MGARRTIKTVGESGEQTVVPSLSLLKRTTRVGSNQNTRTTDETKDVFVSDAATVSVGVNATSYELPADPMIFLNRRCKRRSDARNNDFHELAGRMSSSSSVAPITN